MARAFVYTPEDINKEFEDLWKSLKRNRKVDVGAVDLGAELAPDTTRHNTLQFNENGNVFYVDLEGNDQLIGGTGFSGNTIYSADDSLISNRTIELDDFTLDIQNDGDSYIFIQPDDFEITISANDSGNGLVVLDLLADGAGNDVRFTLQSAYAASTFVSIIGDSVIDRMDYTAQTHRFIGTIGNTAQFANNLAFFQSFDATGDGNSGLFQTQADPTGAGTLVKASFDNDAKAASINVSATTTRGKITISGVEVFADNAAALLGGLVAGDIYRTGDTLKIVH